VTEIDGKVWLLDDPMKVESLKEEEQEVLKWSVSFPSPEDGNRPSF
jgi:hypothetical protein